MVAWSPKRPGSFLGEHEAEGWMPRGLLNSEEWTATAVKGGITLLGARRRACNVPPCSHNAAKKLESAKQNKKVLSPAG